VYYYYCFSVFVKISAVSISYHTSCIDINLYVQRNPRMSWQRDVFIMSCLSTAAVHLRGLRELRDIDAQKVCLVLLCKNAENSSTVCI